MNPSGTEYDLIFVNFTTFFGLGQKLVVRNLMSNIDYSVNF